MPGPAICTGSLLMCAAGAAPTPLTVLPENKTMGPSGPVATIMDNKVGANIVPFGICSILTAAALGVPVPCSPALAAPWTPGCPTVLVGGKPALNKDSILPCAIGGVIKIAMPGPVPTVVIP